MTACRIVVFPVPVPPVMTTSFLEREPHRLALLLGEGEAGRLLDPGQGLSQVERWNSPGGPEEISHAPRELGLGHVESRKVDRPARRQGFHHDCLVGAERGERVRQERRRDLQALLRGFQ